MLALDSIVDRTLLLGLGAPLLGECMCMCGVTCLSVRVLAKTLGKFIYRVLDCMRMCWH